MGRLLRHIGNYLSHNDLRPYLIVKGQQADTVVGFTKAANACVWGEPDQEVFEQFYLECKALNKRGT